MTWSGSRFPLSAEDLTVSKRHIAGDTVQVGTVTRETKSFVDETLNHTRVQIDRIPVGRQVDAVPPVRHEGDTTILPVVEAGEVARQMDDRLGEIISTVRMPRIALGRKRPLG